MERTGRILVAYQVISFVGVILAGWFMTQPTPNTAATRNLMIYSLFSFINILGAVATVFPHRCGTDTNLSLDMNASRYTSALGVQIVHGHHHGCQGFRDHEFAAGGKSFCAACTGLLVGAILSIALSTSYFFSTTVYPVYTGYAGLAFVVLGLLYIPLLQNPWTGFRTIINTIFVLGFSLVLFSVDRLGDPVTDLIVIGLCVYWMYTRIQSSRWGHDKICAGCEEPCDLRAE